MSDEQDADEEGSVGNHAQEDKGLAGRIYPIICPTLNKTMRRPMPSIEMTQATSAMLPSELAGHPWPFWASAMTPNAVQKWFRYRPSGRRAMRSVPPE